MKVPVGAIKTKNELYSVIRAAQEKPRIIWITLYNVERRPALRKRLLDKEAHLDDNGAFHYRSIHDHRPVVVTPILEDGDDSSAGGFVFLNYWHAYAHLLRRGMTEVKIDDA